MVSHTIFCNTLIEDATNRSSTTCLEHCVVLCGYDKEKDIVMVNDPLEGIVERNAERFEELYNQMGKMAVVLLSD